MVACSIDNYWFAFQFFSRPDRKKKFDLICHLSFVLETICAINLCREKSICFYAVFDGFCGSVRSSSHICNVDHNISVASGFTLIQISYLKFIFLELPDFSNTCKPDQFILSKDCCGASDRFCSF